MKGLIIFVGGIILFVILDTVMMRWKAKREWRRYWKEEQRWKEEQERRNNKKSTKI